MLNENFEEKTEKDISKLTKEFQVINDIEKNVKRNLESIDDNKKCINDLEYLINKKHIELNEKIANIKPTTTNINYIEDPKVENSIVSEETNNNTNNIINNPNTQLDQIHKVNKEIDNLKKLNREFHEKIEKSNKLNVSNEYNITIIKKKIEEYTEIKTNISLLQIKSEENSNKIIEKESKLFELDIEKKLNEVKFANINEQINKISDGNKFLTNSNSLKLNKDDFEKAQRNNILVIEKLDKKISENLKIFEKKSELFYTSIKENSEINSQKNNPAEISLFTNGKIEENFKESLLNLISEENEKKKSEILNINKTSIDNLIENYNLNSISLSEIQNKIGEISQTFTNFFDKNFKEFSEEATKKFEFLEEKNQEMKKDTHIRFKNLENIDADFQKDFMEFNDKLREQDRTITNKSIKLLSIQDMLKLVFDQIKNNISRTDSVIIRQDDMLNEILRRVKNDASKENLRIADDLRFDLKNSLGKVEGKLREKADLNHLDEFGRKVDNKMFNEFGKKLDKSDLRKNNNLINKKIDYLENKISKTLVDTLIDLQMEDTPLIVKKSNNGYGEKCASCNQAKIFGNNNNNFHPMNTITNSSSHKESCNFNNVKNITFNNEEDFFAKSYALKTQGNKFKMRNIQDNSNKFGTGSYSRYLNNVDNINEELNSFEKFNSKLPEISLGNSQRKSSLLSPSNTNTKGNTNTYSNGVNNTYSNSNTIGNKFSSKIFNVDFYAEKEYNNMINEELEKKILNPEILLKKANKINDNAEKRNNRNKN